MKAPLYYRRFDYNRELLPNAHLRALEAGVDTIERAESRSGWTVGYPGWGLLYHMLMSHLTWDRSNIIVETGTNWGASTIVLAQALIDAKVEGHVHTFEIEPQFADKAASNVAAAGVAERVTIHLGDAREQLGSVLERVGEVRVAFLDGSHEHDAVLAEFETVLPRLAPTGIVLFDNTFALTDPILGEPARVHEALKTIRSRHGGNLVNFEYVSWYTPGMAVWQR